MMPALEPRRFGFLILSRARCSFVVVLVSCMDCNLSFLSLSLLFQHSMSGLWQDVVVVVVVVMNWSTFMQLE